MSFETRKTVLPFKWQEQNTCKCSINIGQSNKHVIAPRPDVQGMRLDCMFSVDCRDGELFISVIQIILRKVEPSLPHHLRTNRGCGPIASDHDLRIDKPFVA